MLITHDKMTRRGINYELFRTCDWSAATHGSVWPITLRFQDIPGQPGRATLGVLFALDAHVKFVA